MNKVAYALATTLIILVSSCTKAQAPAESARFIEPREVMGMMANNFAVVVDVREQAERSEIIDKAQWVPFSEVDKDGPKWKEFAEKAPKDKTIIFHCVGGSRAEKAAKKLAAAGFKTGFFEGVDQWKSAGLPTKANGQ